MAKFSYVLRQGTINVEGVGPHACSNTRLYMDHAFGVPAISLVPWNETQDFHFVFSPSMGRGPRYEYVVHMSMGQGYGSFHEGTDHQLDPESYGSRHRFPFLCFRLGDNGAGMYVGHGYGLMLF